MQDDVFEKNYNCEIQAPINRAFNWRVTCRECKGHTDIGSGAIGAIDTERCRCSNCKKPIDMSQIYPILEAAAAFSRNHDREFDLSLILKDCDCEEICKRSRFDLSKVVKMTTYAVTVRDGCRETVPADWQEQIEQIEGVKVVSDRGYPSITVQWISADTDVIANKIHKALGEFCYMTNLFPVDEEGLIGEPVIVSL